MRVFVALLGLVAFASSQGGLWNTLQNYWNNNRSDYAIDYVHNYRFEDHGDGTNGFHLLVAISDQSSDRTCHVIEIADTWESALDDPDKLHQITEEIYQLIASGTIKETNLSRDELRQKYGDRDALQECFNHRVYETTYTPSASIV